MLLLEYAKISSNILVPSKRFQYVDVIKVLHITYCLFGPLNSSPVFTHLYRNWRSQYRHSNNQISVIKYEKNMKKILMLDVWYIKYILLIFKVHILFLLFYIRYLPFTINIIFRFSTPHPTLPFRSLRPQPTPTPLIRYLRPPLLLPNPPTPPCIRYLGNFQPAMLLRPV